MTKLNQTREQINQQLATIIAEVTNNELELIEPSSSFEDDLAITLEEDFSRLVDRVNSAFAIELDTEEVIDEVETVSDLANLVLEETELS